MIELTEIARKLAFAEQVNEEIESQMNILAEALRISIHAQLEVTRKSRDIYGQYVSFVEELTERKAKHDGNASSDND